MHIAYRLIISLWLLSYSDAMAETAFPCEIKAVHQTRYAVLVECLKAFPWFDSIENKNVSINWFAPDADLEINIHHIAPPYTQGETMAAYQAVALEAFRERATLMVVFEPSTKPGAQFDCQNDNCRLSSSWFIAH